jgi:uncharacterized coiled-coil protein SlyX
MLLIPTLPAAEDEKIVKLLLCYNSPKSDYCLAEHIFQLKEQVSTQQELIHNLKNKLARLKSKQTQDQQQIKKQQESLQNLKAEITRLESQLGENQKRILALETLVEKQTNTIALLQNTLQSALKRISQLESRLYRYTDNNDGTITDNRTGLLWLKNANCFGRLEWKMAQKIVTELASGQCGLRDHSRAGEWRLPSKEEWAAMMDYRYRKLTLSDAIGTGQWKEGDAFSAVQFSKYWSSTVYSKKKSKSLIWSADIYNGELNSDDQNTKWHVWAIRGELVKIK